MKPERLDKIIASAGEFSRRDVSKMCVTGEIKINDLPVKDPSIKIDPKTVKITVQGKDFIYKRFIYIMLNKPAGVICSTEGRAQKTVIDLLPTELKRPGLFPAGRLDKDTVGLVLITDDGDFAHYILSPRHHVKKVYVFNTRSPLDINGLNRIRNGETGFAPAEIVETGLCTYQITLTEGKYHEIKRMAHIAGSEVTYLKRIKMGDLELDPELAEGECIETDKSQILKIT